MDLSIFNGICIQSHINMITLKNYIHNILINEDKKDKKVIERGDIKFTIWKKPDQKVTWLNNNEDYLKIEYKLENKKKDVYIDFLLGYKDGSWKLWIGKIGATSYTDDPWCSFDTKDFAEAIGKALDKVEEFVEDVYENPDNWVQFYKNV